MFGIAGEDPCKASCPCGEGRVALLCGGAAVGAIGHVEDGFVDNATSLCGCIVSITVLAVVDVVGGGVLGVLDAAVEEVDFEIVLSHEVVAEFPGYAEGA